MKKTGWLVIGLAVFIKAEYACTIASAAMKGKYLPLPMKMTGLFFDFTRQSINPSRFNIKNPYQGDLFMTILDQRKTDKEAFTFLQRLPDHLNFTTSYDSQLR